MRPKTSVSTAAVFTATALCLQPFGTAGDTGGTIAMQSRLAVQQFDPQNVLVAPYDASKHLAFSELLSRSDASYVASVAVIVTNRSSRAIDGLVLRWIVRSANGRDEPSTIPIDRFIRDDGQPIVYPGRSVLVTPTGYITDEQTAGHFITSAFMPKREVDKWLATTAPIRVVLDSVIWDNGTVVGPDAFGIVEWVLTRHSAAKDVAIAVQGQQGNQAAIQQALADMLQAAGSRRSPRDFRAHWIRRFVASAQRNDPFVFRVAALPEPSLRGSSR